jgi:hypothetical protein
MYAAHSGRVQAQLHYPGCRSACLRVRRTTRRVSGGGVSPYTPVRPALRPTRILPPAGLGTPTAVWRSPIRLQAPPDTGFGESPA